MTQTKENPTVITENTIEHSKKSNTVSTENESVSTELPTNKQFLTMTKKFGVESAMLPIEKQMPIQERCTKRARLSTLRKQQNIEAIVEKTYGYCANKTLSKRTDYDWIDRYINLAENVSNNTMQDLWAKILAGELSRPGQYSYKALKVFKEMSIVDAKLLAKACALAVKDQSRKNIRLISGCYQKPGLFNFFNKDRQHFINLSQYGLNYTDLLTLADNHLIFMQENEASFVSMGESIYLSYNNVPFKLTNKKVNTSLQFYKFTPIGAELAHLIADKPDNEYLSHLKQQLSHHFTVSE